MPKFLILYKDYFKRIKKTYLDLFELIFSLFNFFLIPEFFRHFMIFRPHWQASNQARQTLFFMFCCCRRARRRSSSYAQPGPGVLCPVQLPNHACSVPDYILADYLKNYAAKSAAPADCSDEVERLISRKFPLHSRKRPERSSRIGSSGWLQWRGWLPWSKKNKKVGIFCGSRRKWNYQISIQRLLGSLFLLL